MKKSNNRIALYTIVILGIAFIFFRENKKLAETFDQIEAETAKPAAAIAPSSEATSPNLSDSEPALDATKPIPEMTSQEFEVRFKQEARGLDQMNPANAVKEPEVKSIASQFTSAQINYLRNRATAADSTANEKIMATYYLTAAGEKAQQALVDLAGAPFSLPNPQPAHSTGEATLMQEKAIRVMAIDELFTRYENDAITRAEFEKAINAITEISIKQYALKRLSELQ